MKKAILLLFAFSFLASCSNDDNGTQQELDATLKIKKFTITDVNSDNWRIEYNFDEDTKPILYFSTPDGIDGLKTIISYNNSGQLEKVVVNNTYQGNTDFLHKSEYEYNTRNEIERISRTDSDGLDYGELTATHFQDSIQIHRDIFLDGVTDFRLIFGPDNKLIQKNLDPHAYNAHSTVIKYNYNDGNLVNIHEESNSNTGDFYYEFDDKINPLHPILMRDYRNFLLDDLGLYLAFDREYLYSENNITQRNKYGQLHNIIYEYNDLGYPIRGEVTIDGQLSNILIYEYY